MKTTKIIKLMLIALLLLNFKTQASKPKHKSYLFNKTNNTQLDISQPFIGVQTGLNFATCNFTFPGGIAPKEETLTRFFFGVNYFNKLTQVENLYYHVALNLYDGKGTFEPAATSYVQDATARLSYISLSPEARYFVKFGTEKIHPYGALGFYLAYMTKATQQLGSSDAKDMPDDALRSFDYGLNFGTGILYDLDYDSKLTLGINYGLGLFNIENKDAADKGQSTYNRVFTISVSYSKSLSAVKSMFGR